MNCHFCSQRVGTELRRDGSGRVIALCDECVLIWDNPLPNIRSEAIRER